jgi:hypothetical protein
VRSCSPTTSVGVRRYAETENTITHWVDIEGRGGHFAALKEPQLLTDDVRMFFATCADRLTIGN